jgi:hypothetical protein
MKKILSILGGIAILCGLQIMTAKATTCLFSGQGGTGCPSGATIGYNLYVASTTTVGTTTIPLFGYQANGGAASGTFTTVYAGGILSAVGAGTASTTINLTSSTIQSLLSATSPILYNSSTGVFSWTNSLGYFTTSTGNGLYLQIVNNLSDLTNTSTARTNLGLGSIATHPTTDYLASSTTYVATFNTRSGAVTLTSGDVTTALGFTPGTSNVATSSPTSPGLAYFTNGSTLSATTSYVSSFNGATGTITYAPSTTIPTTYVTSFGGMSGVITTNASTGIAITNSGGVHSIQNTGVTSFTGQGCVTAANSTGTVALTVTCISGNQSITFTIGGDATGTGSGTTAITDNITVTGLNGKALPALATGTLQYTSGAWKINLATSSLGQYDANGNLFSYLGSACTGGQYVAGFSASGTVACGTPSGGSSFASTTPWTLQNPVVASGTGVATISTSTLVSELNITSSSLGVATGSPFTYFVAASNAPASEKIGAYAICSSTSDDTCIQTAVTAASSSGNGGYIRLSDGTFGYQVSGVATSVKEFANNISIIGETDGGTNWTSVVTSTPLIQIGNYQANQAPGQLTNWVLSYINFTMGTQTSTVAAVKVDGGGNGGEISHVTTNYGGYGFQLEDLDRVNIENDICNNAYISCYWMEEGLSNTYGNVVMYNDTAALNSASSSDVLMSADADQGSPAAFARISMLADTWHSNTGIASTTGISIQGVPTRAFTVQDTLFESDTWGIITTSEDHLDLIGNQWTNNNPFSATSSIDCLQFNNNGGGNAFVDLTGNAFSNCVNVFHSVGSSFPTLFLEAVNKNDGNLTNMFVGSYSYKAGDDINFAGAGNLTSGLSTAPYSNVYTQVEHVGTTTVSGGNYIGSYEDPNGNTGVNYGAQFGTGPSDANNTVIGNQFSDTGGIWVRNQSGGGDTFVGYGDSIINPRSGCLIVGSTTSNGQTGCLLVVGTSTFQGNVSTTIPNALVLSNASSVLTNYTATSCAAGTAFTGLSATGTPTCTSYAPSSTIYGAGTYLAVSGSNLTVSSTLASSSVSFNFQLSTTTVPYNSLAIYNTTQKQLAWADCTEATNNATTTVTVGYATSSAKAVAGTIGQNLITNFACGFTQNTTTTFTTSTLPAGSWIITNVSSTAGSPTNFLLDLSAYKQ